MSPRSRTGVTFIEIISVLAIIGVVAAVLFPVFQKVRERPHGSCASNMKQIGLAFTQYTQDSDDKLPSGINATGNGWAGALYPFIKSTGVYRCPDDKQEGSYISYAENQNMVKQSLNNLAVPSATVAVYEFATLNCDPSTPETVSATGLSAPQSSKRHDGSTFNCNYSLNFLAVDGHVKFLMPGQVSGGPTAISAKAIPQGAYIETFAIK